MLAEEAVAELWPVQSGARVAGVAGVAANTWPIHPAIQRQNLWARQLGTYLPR